MGHNSESLVRLPLAAARRVQLPLASEARDVDRRVRPRVAVWELTLRCNLSCKHCGSRAGKPRSDELSLEECLSLVESLARPEVLEVSLIGGEAHLQSQSTGRLHAVRIREGQSPPVPVVAARVELTTIPKWLAARVRMAEWNGITVWACF